MKLDIRDEIARENLVDDARQESENEKNTSKESRDSSPFSLPLCFLFVIFIFMKKNGLLTGKMIISFASVGSFTSFAVFVFLRRKDGNRTINFHLATSDNSGFRRDENSFVRLQCRVPIKLEAFS